MICILSKPSIKAALLVLGFIPAQLLAVSNTLAESPFEPEAFIKMFIGLIAVVALIFIVAALSKKMKIMQSFTTGYQIKNLASLALTAREKVCLIEVGGKQVLIGVAPGRVNQLHVFEEGIEIPNDESPVNKDSAFAKHFKNAIGITSTAGTQK
ncbi:MAG: flagellar protein FliO/FliZ [Enterobacterales bacterium]|jgi:flagellar protein FliO/FliZ